MRAAHRRGRRRAGDADQAGPGRADRVRRAAARRGGGRQEVHRRPGRDARRRGADARRGDRRPGLAGRRPAGHQAGDLARLAGTPARPPVALVAAGLLARGAARRSSPRAPRPRRSGDARRGSRPRRSARGLFAAQTELILGDRAAARRAADAGRGAYRGELRDAHRRRGARGRRRRPPLRCARAAPRGRVAATQRGARRRARQRSRARCSAARWRSRSRRSAPATSRTARAWLLLREFRTATRLTRPGADATLALRGLERGADRAPDAAAQAVRRTCSTPTRAASATCSATPTRPPSAACRRGSPRRPRRPPRTGRSSRRATPRTAATRPPTRSGEEFAALAARGAPPATWPRSGRPRRGRRRARELHRRAADRRGVRPPRPAAAALPRARPGRVRPRRQGHARHARLRDPGGGRVPHRAPSPRSPTCRTSSPSATRRAPRRSKDRIDELGEIVGEATEKTEGVRPADDVEALTKRIQDDLAATMPEQWQEPNDESDYDLIALTLDRLEAAVGAQQYQQAEQARLEAYAFFEFGPERRLKSFDPGLATDVEGLVWFGAVGKPGLATLIADRAPRREIHETRLVLDEKLADAAATLGDSANKATVVTNSAIIVFREGLEAVLILAAITASFVGVRRRLRRPVLVGAAARPGRVDAHVGARADAAAVARALRREARGGGRADRDRRAAADHELVLPPRVLERVDRPLPPPPARADARRGGRLLLGPGARAGAARPHVASTARASRPCCSCSRSS